MASIDVTLWVCSDTWRKDVRIEEIENAINMAAPGKLRVVSVSQVVPMKNFLNNSFLVLDN